MIADFGVLLTLLRMQGANMAKKLIVGRLTKSWPTLMATPILGPIVGYIVGSITTKIVKMLAEEAEFLTFLATTYFRVTAQAKALNKAQDKIETAKTESELDAAEKESLQAFDDLAKFNR